MPRIFRNYDQISLDAQYNNRALVPDFATHLERWEKESADVRHNLRCRLDIPYGPAPLERVDFFPASRRCAPVHLFIHGGYWRALDKSSFSHLAPGFVQAGVSYAALNYPLAPATRMDAIVRSVRRAILWLTHHAKELDIDPLRITISGHSAGGHLVAMIIATDWSTFDTSVSFPQPSVKAGISLSGLYDLEPIRLSYLNADLRLGEPEASRNSPIGLIPRINGSLTLAVGAIESDEFRRQQRDFLMAWRQHGLTIESHEFADHNHFTIVQEIESAASGIHRTLMERIERS